MERCYEYFNCQKSDCVAHGATGEKPCWEMEETLCKCHDTQAISDTLGNKMGACTFCAYAEHCNAEFFRPIPVESNEPG